MINNDFWDNHPELDKNTLAPRMMGTPCIKHFLMEQLYDLLLIAKLELYDSDLTKQDTNIPYPLDWEKTGHWFRLIHPYVDSVGFIKISH